MRNITVLWKQTQYFMTNYLTSDSAVKVFSNTHFNKLKHITKLQHPSVMDQKKRCTIKGNTFATNYLLIIYTMCLNKKKHANFLSALCLSNMNRLQRKFVGMSENKQMTKTVHKVPTIY